MDDIRVGVAGLGPRGLHWIGALETLDGYRVTGICDPIEALHAPALERTAEPAAVTTYTRYDDLLDGPVDAIALTLRCREQGALAAQALDAGKHVNAEVPGAHTVEDCRLIVEAQQRTGLVYQLAEQVRYAGYVEAWRRMVADGTLGKITYCEGQYLHYFTERHFRDPDTGAVSGPGGLTATMQPTWLCEMPPIHYLPHDLGPLLKILDDRVVDVVGMSTDPPSLAHPEIPTPDLQVALMKTAKGTLMRLMASFSQPHPRGETHWLQIIGTGGSAEWRRSGNDKPRLWLADGAMDDKQEMDWRYQREDAPEEATGSGHNDMDYYVHTHFRNAVRGIAPLEYDVYAAMDTTLPAILAAESIARGGVKLSVPSLRPEDPAT